MIVTLPAWHFATRRQIGRSGVDTDGALTPIEIDALAWLAPEARLLAFDRRIHAAEDGAHAGFLLRLHGPEPALSVARRQVELRYQRLFTQRNRASDSAIFDAILARHAALHDRSKPLVRADHDHALDVWQWLLRLAPDASEALQIAALFHDIERLRSEAERRVEQHAGDYLAFKLQHAADGAEMTRAALSDLGLASELLARAAALVAVHEQPGADRDLALLNEADALSFFALNSPGFLAYFGPEHTVKKVRYTLARMRSEAAHAVLAEVRLEPEIAGMIAGARDGRAQPT